MIKYLNLATANACRQALIGLHCVLAVSWAWLACAQNAGVDAPAPATPQFRVGNLIANGFFGDPQNWQLTNFGVDAGQWIHRKNQPGGSGSAATPFLGPDGFYKIRIQYLDEGDGVSKAWLKVGDRDVGTWAFDGILIDTLRWKEFDGVQINTGDAIVLAGRAGGYEYCRIIGMEILPSQPVAETAAAAVVEPREYSLNLVPVPASAAILGPDYLLAPNRFFTGGAGTYWLYLTTNQIVPLVARTGFAGQPVSLRYSLTRLGAAEPIAAETLVSAAIQPIHIQLCAGETGLYELSVSPAPGVQQAGLLVQFDAPAVTGLGAGEGYFFVPKDTKVFSVKSSGHTVLLDAAGNTMLDELFDTDAVRNVEVPARSANQVWYFQGPLKQLIGVPAYVGSRPQAMLTPREVLQ